MSAIRKPSATSVSRSPAKRSSSPARASAAAVPMFDEVSGTAEDLRQLKLSLMATREKLLLVSPDLLNDRDHAAWSTQIFEVSRAISAIRNASLERLSQDFKRELPAFSAATQKLVDDLFALQKATAVIKAVAGVLSVITRLVKLAG